MTPIINLILSLSAQSRRITVHELDRTHVEAPRRRPGRYVAGSGFSGDPKYPNTTDLVFSLWQLVHAIRQAELLRTMNPWSFRISSLGLFLECSQYLSNTPDLRLMPGAVSLYGDFSRTTLAGRVAQGIAFLFMRDRGYPYGERLETLLVRCNMLQFAY
jgi:hypothetical protein